MRLYELTANYKELEHLLELENNNTEENNADTKLLEDALDCIKDDINEKAENIGKIILNERADIEQIKKEIERLKNVVARKERTVDNLLNYIKKSMEFLKFKEIKTPIISFFIRKNPAKLEILNESLIPDIYFKIKRELDNAAIKEALKNGSKIDGAELITTNTSLMIK